MATVTVNPTTVVASGAPAVSWSGLELVVDSNPTSAATANAVLQPTGTPLWVEVGQFGLAAALPPAAEVTGIIVTIRWSGYYLGSTYVELRAGGSVLRRYDGVGITAGSTPGDNVAYFPYAFTAAQMAGLSVRVGGLTTGPATASVGHVTAAVTYTEAVATPTGMSPAAITGGTVAATARNRAAAAPAATTTVTIDAALRPSQGFHPAAVTTTDVTATARNPAAAAPATATTTTVAATAVSQAAVTWTVGTTADVMPVQAVVPLPTVHIGARTTDWVVALITPTGEPVGTLQVVEGSGSHDWTLDAEIPVTWRCQVLPTMTDGQPLPDLEGLWVQLTHHIAGRPRTVLTGPVTGAPRRLTDAAEIVSLSGMDPTWVVQQAGIRWHQVYDTGTPVVATVRGLLSTYAPAVTAVIEPADDTLREPLSFQAGDSVLTVVNRLLEAAGYTWLAARPDGTLWSDRWAPPATRPIALTFDDHTEAGYLPEVDVDDDWLSRPTEVVARTSGSQAVEAVVGRWPDYLPDAPRTEVITVDATTVEVATLHARRRWEERQQATHIIDASGPWQPLIAGDVVRFAYDTHGFEAVAEVASLRTVWNLAGLTDYELTGVAT